MVAFVHDRVHALCLRVPEGIVFGEKELTRKSAVNYFDYLYLSCIIATLSFVILKLRPIILMVPV